MVEISGLDGQIHFFLGWAGRRGRGFTPDRWGLRSWGEVAHAIKRYENESIVNNRLLIQDWGEWKAANEPEPMTAQEWENWKRMESER